MKKVSVYLLALFLAAFLAVTAFASTLLSPSLEIIAADCEMLKSAPLHEDVEFTKDDFCLAAGAEIKSITITSLPPSGDGSLLLGTSRVSTNQTISAANLNLLRFVPASGVSNTSFRFTYDRSYTTECVINILDHENSAPVADVALAVPVWTQCDVSCYGNLKGYDPDGDRIIFEVTEYQSEGLLEITDKEAGSYIYTPYSGFRGVDSFSYRIRDEYGCYSDEYKMTVKIDKRVTDMVMSDMDGHWGQNAAMVMVADGVMDVISENGKNYFDPDEIITREDFLMSVMKSFGAGELSPRATVFADNSAISSETSGYVAAAYKLGIIKGENRNGQLYFRPNDSITRAEAAAILNRIIGAEASGAVSVFADESASTAWAVADLYAISELGIISCDASGSIGASTPLDRAQTAQMLMNAKFLFEAE